jgi:autotransporter strand-loop-strand O-heptosyltransferase
MLKKLDYDIVVLSGNEYKISYGLNVYGKSWDEVATYLHHAEAFIGLGSGLSWINWAIGKHTYMINGFVEEGHEFTSNLTKITNNICIKCWNDPVHVFDAGDWNWCPVYKGTERQHICQKSITPLQVFNSIKL